MVELNATLIIQMINFFILIFLLHGFLYKPILSIMHKRKTITNDLRDEAQSLHDAIDQKVAEYEETLQRAKAEAMGQRDQIRAEGVRLATAVIDEAKNEISSMSEEFRKQLGKEREEAEALLQTRTRSIALEIAEKVLGRAVQ